MFHRSQQRFHKTAVLVLPSVSVLVVAVATVETIEVADELFQAAVSLAGGDGAAAWTQV